MNYTPPSNLPIPVRPSPPGVPLQNPATALDSLLRLTQSQGMVLQPSDDLGTLLSQLPQFAVGAGGARIVCAANVWRQHGVTVMRTNYTQLYAPTNGSSGFLRDNMDNPTTPTSATLPMIAVGGTNCVLKGLVFSDPDGVRGGVRVIEISQSGVTLEDCVFINTGGIRIARGNDCRIVRCRFIQCTTDPVVLISTGARHIVAENRFESPQVGQFIYADDPVTDSSFVGNVAYSHVDGVVRYKNSAANGNVNAGNVGVVTVV